MTIAKKVEEFDQVITEMGNHPAHKYRKLLIDHFEASLREVEEEASKHTATCTALQENGMVNDFCCQPLTEGEGELSKTGHTLGAVIDCKKCEKSHVFEIMGVKQEAKECHCSRTSEFHHQDSTFKYHSYDICSINPLSKPQQESKEEEYIDGFKIECEHGSRGRCLKCLGLEEPSKKPSERIEEMLENLIGQPAYQSMFATIVAYLDELHKAGKI